MEFIQGFWLDLLLTVVTGVLAFFCKKWYNDLKAEREKRHELIVADEEEEKLLKTAVLALLHDRMLQSLVYYLNTKEITSDQMDNMKIMYDAYRKLGGNGTIKILWERFIKYVRILPPDYLDIHD